MLNKVCDILDSAYKAYALWCMKKTLEVLELADKYHAIYNEFQKLGERCYRDGYETGLRAKEILKKVTFA